MEQAILKRIKGRHGLGNVSQHRVAWWLDVRIEGARHRVKLGPIKLFEKREARQLADAKIKELLTPKPPERKGAIAFSEFAKKVLARAVETKRSWAQYVGKPVEQTPLVHAVRFFGDVPLRDITADRVEDFRSYLLKQRVGPRRLKPASANRYVSLFRHALNCAVRWGDADSNPAAGIKMLQEAPMPERVLSETEQAALLEVMPTWLRLMTIFVLQTALRRGDVLNLTWAAVQGSGLELCETKEGKKRHVPLNATARSVLSVLLAGRKPKHSDYVFDPGVDRHTLLCRIRHEWERALKASGIPKFRFHDLRHTALTRLVQVGADVRTVQAIAGHSSLRTTQRYLHSSDQQKMLAVEKLDQAFRAPKSDTNLPTGFIQ